MTVWRDGGLFREGLSILLGYVLVLDNYDVLGWMLNPFSNLVYVSVGVYGLDERGSCNFDYFRALNNRFQGDADGFSATGENAGGVDVAVNGGMVGDAVLPSDLVGTAPAEKFVFDGFAVRVAADVAAAGVRAHRGAGFRLGWATSVAAQATAEPIILFGLVLVLGNALVGALRLGGNPSLFRAGRGLVLPGLETWGP